MAIRKLPPWALTLLSLVPALLLLPFAKVIPTEAVMALSAAAIIWAVALGCLGWRRMDETGRAAHKFAWFTGGSLGLLAALIASMVIMATPAAGNAVADFVGQFPKHPAGQMGFVFGLLAAGVAQVIGYAIVWTMWWAKRR